MVIYPYDTINCLSTNALMLRWTEMELYICLNTSEYFLNRVIWEFFWNSERKHYLNHHEVSAGTSPDSLLWSVRSIRNHLSIITSAFYRYIYVYCVCSCILSQFMSVSDRINIGSIHIFPWQEPHRISEYYQQFSCFEILSWGYYVT